MRRTWNASVLAGAVLLGAVVGDAMGRQVPEIILLTVDGERLEVRSLRLDASDLARVETADGSREIPIGEIVVAEVRGELDTAARTDPDDVTLLLIDGGRLAGRLGPAGEDWINLEHPTLGRLEIPIDAVRAATFGVKAGRSDPIDLDRREHLGEDIVYRGGSVEGDYLTGTLLAVGREGVEIEGELGIVELTIDRLLGIVVAPLEDDDAPPNRRVELELSTGDRLVGDLRSLSTGFVKIGVAFVDELRVPLEQVRRIRFSSERFEYLSDLDPVDVQELPFIGEPDDFLFPWRRDRTVTGGPLSVQGQTFGRGLGLHARCRLTYRLDGEYRQLTASVGIADEVLDHGIEGSAVVRWYLDGELKLESPALRAGRPPVEMKLTDLPSGGELVVEVDFADRGDTGDRVVVGDPLLLR